jgi:hypothetical protein
MKLVKINSTFMRVISDFIFYSLGLIGNLLFWKSLSIGFCFLVCNIDLFAQAVPAKEENIPFLVTFGKQSDISWGDDDFSQVFFFGCPVDFKEPFYIRVFDPECSGANDELKGDPSTTTKYSIYGGIGCISGKDATAIDPKGDYKSGNLLASRSFSQEKEFDNAWYTFGPFNPGDGEFYPKYGGIIFKIICEGIKGDDGNLYRYFISTSSSANYSVPGGNAFTFEYSFRLHSEPFQTSHVYPFIDDKVISVGQRNFDWDDDGFIKIFSVATIGEKMATSGDNSWATSVYIVKEKEKLKSLDVQFTKDSSRNVRNNNVVYSMHNQYGELLPFYTVPIGGVPKFEGTAVAKPIKKK